MTYHEKLGEYWDFTPYKDIDLSGEGYKPDYRGNYFHLARQARDLGWRHIVPIAPGSKACFQKGWDRWAYTEPTDDEIRGWIKGNPRQGLGPQIGFGYAHNKTLVVIDLDYNDADEVARRVWWLANNVSTGTPCIRVGKGPGCQIYFQARNTAYGRVCGPEIFHENKQTVLFGTHPGTGKPYRWKGGSPATRKLQWLPEIGASHLDGFLLRFGHDRMPGRRGGMIMSILKARPANAPEPMPLEEMAECIRQAGKSMRHPTAQALVSHAYFNMYSVKAIISALKPAFLGAFQPGERRNLGKEFDEFIPYAQRRTPRSIGGIHVPGQEDA